MDPLWLALDRYSKRRFQECIGTLIERHVNSVCFVPELFVLELTQKTYCIVIAILFSLSLFCKTTLIKLRRKNVNIFVDFSDMSSLFGVDICSQLLDKNPYDEAVWSLKVRATKPTNKLLRKLYVCN
jgi:hypothetical protein